MEESPKKTCCRDRKYLKGTANWLKLRIPIIVWLPKYRWKDNLVSDVVAGITQMFINVPQGLAFAILANVELIYGLYTSCFGAFIYTLLGTAHVSSFGPVAVGSILTGEAVSKVHNTDFTTSQIAIVLTFLIGLWYFIAFLLSLGVINTIFRKPFVSGFIAACSLHIFIKSVKMLFGIRARNRSGLLSFFYNLYAIFDNYRSINYPTVIVSFIIITILVLNLTLLRHIIAKHTKLVLPIEAAVMMIATTLSYLLNFEEMGVPVVGKVPTGLPTPKLPEISLISEVWASSLTVAVINYATTASMTLLFNKKLDKDQELLALAATNLIGCNFQCITIGNSMMRTMVAVNLEVKSLLATVISSALMFFVILYAGPLFHPLPNCVLGCIIVVSAGQLFLARMKEVKSIWKSSLENRFIWLATFAAGLFGDLQTGMLAGGILSLRQILFEVESREKSESEKRLAEENMENGKLEVEEPESSKMLLTKDEQQNAKVFKT